MSGIFPLVLGLGVLVVGAWIVSMFVRLERTGRSYAVLGVVLGVVMVEAMLNPGTADVPIGLFRPSIGGQDLRLPDLVIALALLARVIARPSVKRISTTIATWGALLVWLGVSTVLGLANGAFLQDVLFDLKSYLYIVAMVALVAGVPIAEILDRRRFTNWLLWVATVSLTFMAMSLAGITFGLRIPGAPLPTVGDLSSETHSMLIVIGLLALAMEACDRKPRPKVILASVSLLCAPLVGFQRASFVQLAVSLVVLVLISLGTTWARRVQFTLTDALLFTSVFLLSAGALLSASGEISTLSNRISRTFYDSVEAKTAHERVEILEQSQVEMKERPVFGWGMGHRVEHKFGWDRDRKPVTSHNVFVDMILRAGGIGLVLLAVAVAPVMVAASRVWRWDSDGRVAGAAMGAIAALAGLVAKGMVETIFEKFRLGITFGFLLGLILSAYAAYQEKRRFEISSFVLIHERGPRTSALLQT